MRDRIALEASYRRLLWAYPRFYRRLRGLEILTTLMDAAKPGQVRPSREETVHMLLSGLRCRLAPPGWAGKVAAFLVTLWAAVVLGGGGAYAVWKATMSDPPYPDDPAITALSDDLVGRSATKTGSSPHRGPLDMAYSHKSWAELQNFAAEGWAGAKPEPASHYRRYEQVGSAKAIMTAAYQRLSDEGWKAGAVVRSQPCGCELFWASRDGFLLYMSAVIADDEQSVTIHVHRVEAEGVFEAAIAGLVLGIILTWPAMTWLLHRFTRAPRGDRVLALVFALPLLYACLANTVDNALSMVPDPDTESVFLAADLMYPLANQIANPLAAIVVGLGLLACVIITTFTPWHRFLGPIVRPVVAPMSASLLALVRKAASRIPPLRGVG